MEIVLKGPGGATLSNRIPLTFQNWAEPLAPLLRLVALVETTKWPDQAPVVDGRPQLCEVPQRPTRIRPPDRLLEAFNTSVYRAFDPPSRFTLRIGEPNEGFAKWLAALGAEQAALITAENPFGQRQADEESDTASGQLVLHAMNLGVPLFPGECASEDGQWRESARLLVGIDERQADDIARKFSQAAWVLVDRHGVARLKPCAYYPPNDFWRPCWPEGMLSPEELQAAEDPEITE
jgi:hypothetical protein